jgi:hypothetical protein
MIRDCSMDGVWEGAVEEDNEDFDTLSGAAAKNLVAVSENRMPPFAAVAEADATTMAVAVQTATIQPELY